MGSFVAFPRHIHIQLDNRSKHKPIQIHMCNLFILIINDAPLINKLPGVFIIRGQVFSGCPKKHLRSIQRRSPALAGAAPGATHSVTSLRKTTASMRTLFLIITPYIVFYKTRIKHRLKMRTFFQISEIPNSTIIPYVI